MSRPSRARNLGLAGIAALTGCVSLIVVMAALLLGLWLDSQIGQRGPATICTLILSVPVSLFLMIRIALGLVNRIQPQQTEVHGLVSPEEEED